MPRVSDVFKAERLKPSEVSGPVTVIIKSALVDRPGYGGGVERTIDVELNGAKRFVKVTPQLAADLVAVTGQDESLLWIDKAASLYPKEELIKNENKIITMFRACAAKDVPDSIIPSNGSTPPKLDDMGDEILF